MKRPDWARIWMDLAVTLAERSTCARLKVGCVIVRVDNTQVLSIGYNGNYSGGPNGCDSTTPGACGCLHAEDNALLKYSRDWYGATMYVTHLPCYMCAKRIINAGVYNVVYLHEYRSDKSKSILPRVLQYVDHGEHGLAPDDAGCPCMYNPNQEKDCAEAGCGFCLTERP